MHPWRTLNHELVVQLNQVRRTIEGGETPRRSSDMAACYVVGFLAPHVLFLRERM